jgi:hypothetical protein
MRTYSPPIHYLSAKKSRYRGWNMVKTLVCAIAASCSILSNSAAQSLKPSNVIDFAKVKIAGSACKVNLPSGFSNIQWVDDSRLLASTYWAHCDDAVSTDPKKFETQAVLFDPKGTILATDHGHASLYTKGPHGTVAALQTGEINLLDAQMHAEQSIPCPNNSKTCGITLTQSLTLGSDFALCTSSGQSEQVCDFYTGWPATKVRQAAFPTREDPFTHLASNAWQASASEKWLFESGHLTSVRADGSRSLVNPTNFVGDNGGGCNGQLSESSPRRFLATCVGTHWYSDGMFDGLFGFSRTLLFDVSTKSIIGRVDGSAFISAALSPSGRKIAILKGGKVRLYDAP